MSIAVNIWLNSSHIHFPSQHCRGFGWCLPSTFKLTACANMVDCKSSAPVHPRSWVTVCVSCVFYLSSRSGGNPSPSFLYYCDRGEGSIFGHLYQKAPRWETFLCNAEDPHSYLSLSLHLLELATSHFASDPSVNSWVPGCLAVAMGQLYILTCWNSGEWVSRWVSECWICQSTTMFS